MDLFITILTMYSGITACYFACFGPPTNSMLALDYFFELMFLLDIFKTFLTQYWDEDNRVWVRDLKKIAIRYIQGRFLVELAAMLTLPLIWAFTGTTDEETLHVLYLLRLFRIARAATIIDTQRFQEYLK